MEQDISAELIISPFPLIDGHTHVDQYPEGDLVGLLNRAKEAGVGAIIAAGTNLESCNRILKITKTHPIVKAGIGIHPTDVTWPLTSQIIDELKQMASDPSVVVWSETGLDYLPTSPDKGLQIEFFREQIKIAKEFKLPLVIHSREADEDVLEILHDERADEVGGAWHYFGGDKFLANEVLKLGFYLSFAKTLIREPSIQETLNHVPLNAIVIETDAYPQPFKKNRLRWTEPWQLPQVAQKIAEIKNVSLDIVARESTNNYAKMTKGRLRLEDLPYSIL